MTYTTHFICYYIKSDHSENETDPLPPHHGLLFYSSKIIFYLDRIVHIMAFHTPVIEHWLEQETD